MSAPTLGADGGGRPGPPASRNDETGWDRYVAAHPEGTIFHSRAWARIVLAAFPSLHDASVVAPAGVDTCVLPLYNWSRGGGLFRTLQSSFPFAYGGPVPARDGSGADLAGCVLGGLRHPFCSWRVTGNPFATTTVRSTDTDIEVDVAGAAIPEVTSGTGAPRLPFPSPGFEAEPDSTHLLSLPATEEEYWDGVLSTAQRNDWRRLAKKGVTVEESRNPADVAAFYALYRASFSHWGSPPRFVHPAAFYEALLDHGGEAVRFTVVRHEGRLAGGCFVLRWNGKAHYLAGYFDREARAVRPAALLQVESILAAIRAGCRWYDFLPSGGHASVEGFKESFGGCRTPFTTWTRRGGLHRLRRGVR